jgi:hypothetical protein
LTQDAEKRRYKINMLEQIYKEQVTKVTSNRLLNALTKTFGATAKKILQQIVLLLIGPQEQIRWLTDAVMREYTFATMDDSDDIYCYNHGIFVKGGNTLIKKQIELLYPNATTYKVNEITNHIRRSTFVSRSDFDNNIDLLNTENCVLNLHTLEVEPHSPN